MSEDFMPDLNSYDHVISCFSGGKDSLAMTLYVLMLGLDAKKLELWHHCVDGREDSTFFMDWPVTESYCRAVAEYLDVPLFLSWRKGGFLGEMLREQSPTAPVMFETPTGIQSRGGNGPPNTRLKFPMPAASLSIRWCSAYVKVDVAAAALRAQERFRNKRTLVITGERAEESPARSKYAVFEKHRTDARNGKHNRHVDHWRPVHGWSEQEVWDVIEASRLSVHPAYECGWTRLSCKTCVFGSPNQWATIRAISPERFNRIANYEKQFGYTIHRKHSVEHLADKGEPYKAALDNPELVSLAMSDKYTRDMINNSWKLPAGAFGESAGPT